MEPHICPIVDELLLGTRCCFFWGFDSLQEMYPNSFWFRGRFATGGGYGANGGKAGDADSVAPGPKNFTIKESEVKNPRINPCLLKPLKKGPAPYFFHL